MLDAVDAIPDIFKTVLNVTTDMAAAVVVTAGEQGRANL
jgi:Na+/H+-dicarboxylate symporter